jgi:hypothetical protein
MTALILYTPRAQHVPPTTRAELLLGMAVDAHHAAADATAQVPDRLKAELLAAVERGDWPGVMSAAARLSGHVGARSA